MSALPPSFGEGVSGDALVVLFGETQNRYCTICCRVLETGHPEL